MDDFRENKSTVLITTNVLARGIDVLAVGYSLTLCSLLIGFADCHGVILTAGNAGHQFRYSSEKG